MEKIVVTRHRGLVAWLIEKKLINKDTRIIAHAEPSDLKGKHVIGVLPYRLSVHAEKYTEIQLRLPSDKRNTELSLEDVKWYAKDYRTYIVTNTTFKDINTKRESKRQRLRDLQVDEYIINQILEEKHGRKRKGKS